MTQKTNHGGPPTIAEILIDPHSYATSAPATTCTTTEHYIDLSIIHVEAKESLPGFTASMFLM